MSFSTPITKRSSTSTSVADRQESDCVSSSRQEDDKDMLKEDLARAQWQLAAPHLARALSFKTLKDNAEPIEEIDHILRYDVLIDKALDGVLLQAAEMLTVPTIADISKTKGHPKPGLDPKPEGDTKREKNTTNERDHYDYLAKFLNECLELCRRFFPHLVGEYYQNLVIGVYDRPTMDGISDTPPLKPDLVGTTGPFHRGGLWWADEKPGLGRTVLLPLEVKKMSSDLIAQAATYGRALFSVAPFRQFALVLGYDHDAQSLYFLVFHCGGVTMSEALSVQDASDKKEILRLFLSILTWKTPGDAGFAKWFGGLGLFIPRYPGDTEGVFLHVMQMLFRKSSLVGRGQSILHCMTTNDGSAPSSLIPLVQTSGAVKYVPLADDPRISSQARVDRMSQSGSAVGESSGHPSLSSSCKRPSEHNTEPEVTKKARLETSEARPEPIVLRKDDGRAVYVPQKIEAEYVSCNIPTDKALDLVLKPLWLSVGSGNVESKLLKACGGMFGVVEHYYSTALSHNPGVLSTNHLFLPDEAKAPGNTEGQKKDRRVLWPPALNFAGESLVKASTPKMLITSVIHAILGYRNILFKGYQHRDISIGNVLFREEPVKKNLLQDLKDTKAPDGVLELAAKLGINDECNGCVIDGDLAIILTSYFTEKRKQGRSGTKEFMLPHLLNSMNKDESFLQSPMDDFFSFYFVIQWAAVFNNHEFTDARRSLPLPKALFDARKSLLEDGDGDGRASVASTIQNMHKYLEPEMYGQFLSNCGPFLSDLYGHLFDKRHQWRSRLKGTQSSSNSAREYAEMFEELTDELVLDALKLFDKHLSSLS